MSIRVMDEPGGHVTSEAQDFIRGMGDYYAIIPEALVLSRHPAAVVLYGVLDRMANKGDCFASIPTLCERTGFTASTIRRARTFLIDNGWLEVVKTGVGHRSTDYRLPFQQRPGRGNELDTSEVTPETYQTEKETETIKQSPKREVARSHNTAKAPPSVSEEFRAKMREKYAGLSEVNDRINDALNHTAVKKAIDIERYVDGWLRRDAERQGAVRQHAPDPDFDPVQDLENHRNPEWRKANGLDG